MKDFIPAPKRTILFSKHYRDSSGQEVDAVFELENGEYCAAEIKISSDEKNLAEGIASLNGVRTENDLS